MRLKVESREATIASTSSCVDRIGFDECDVDFAADGAGVAEERRRKDEGGRMKDEPDSALRTPHFFMP
jgi:hypothetical protein